MKKIPLRTIGFAILTAALLPALASAQDKATIRVAAIKPTPALVASVTDADKKLEMWRITESLDSQFTDRINATHKFDVVGGSDLKDAIGNQDLENSGNFDPKTAAKEGALTGAKYILVTTVDDYQDYVETAHFDGTDRSATKRVIRLSCVGKIYDLTTGKLLESANFQTGNDAFKDIEQVRSYSTKDGNLSDEMMVALARDMAGKIANHIVDVIFPAKVIAKNDGDKQVTINRGEGTGVAVGDTLNVFALGEEMIDPDTKESLGREEAKVGQVKITEVDPMFSKAQILDDTGIVPGAILRKPQ